jgi:hypothetical protein
LTEARTSWSELARARHRLVSASPSARRAMADGSIRPLSGASPAGVAGGRAGVSRRECACAVLVMQGRGPWLLAGGPLAGGPSSQTGRGGQGRPGSRAAGRRTDRGGRALHVLVRLRKHRHVGDGQLQRAAALLLRHQACARGVGRGQRSAGAGRRAAAPDCHCR